MNAVSSHSSVFQPAACQPASDAIPDYAYRRTPPADTDRQLTRLGWPKAGLDDPRLARRTWFILRTAAREELTAAIILERSGCAVLHPRRAVFRKINRYRHGKVELLQPLLVRYLFVGFDGAPNWLQALACSSVSGFVGIGGHPRSIAFDTIAAFMRGHRCHDAPGHHRHMLTHHEFEAGDTVEVLRGPLRGHHVQVEAIEGAQARALLTLFGREQSVDMALDNLVPVRA